MSDDKFDLSRRKLLGAVGTIGGAATLGGAGSMAYFSDQEEFANNQLVAGELDMKVDWQEHYSDWSTDESEGIETVSMEPGDGLTGFPSAAPETEQSVFVSDPAQFLENTAIESFPDILSDPAESDEAYDALQAQLPNDSDICDLPADLDGVLSHPFRTQGTFPSADGDANPQTTEPGDPLVNISDVKPGDFGEVTLSFHVCGNPGYVWLTGGLRSAAENGLTEPERKDPDEDGDPDSTTPADVELLDAVQAAFWYDTGDDDVYGADFADKDAGEGDNYAGSGEGVIQVGTLGSVLLQLQNNAFPLDAEPVSDGSGGGTGDGDNGNGGTTATPIGSLDETSFTQYTSTVDEPFQSYVTNQGGQASPRNLNCADYETVLGLDLSMMGTAIEEGMFTEGMNYNSCADLTIDSFDQSTGEITLSSGNPVLVVSVKGGNEGEEIYVFDDPVVLDGVTFSTPTGQNISNIDVCCPVDDENGNGGGGGQQNGDRQCFPNSTTAYVGFEWWLPVDHANEIQTDSVSFDLGFYTEQCRHNDGLGNVPN
jgi:predicted ribosomally synthesized peptide with SipW-like signal peptide